MTRHHKCGFGCVTKHKLPSQLIPVAQSILDKDIEDMTCQEIEKDNVMPIITIVEPLQISWPMPHLRKCQ